MPALTGGEMPALTGPRLLLQYLEPSPAVDEADPRWLRDHLAGALGRLPVTDLALGWRLSAEVIEAIRSVVPASVSVWRWVPVFVDSGDGAGGGCSRRRRAGRGRPSPVPRPGRLPLPLSRPRGGRRGGAGAGHDAGARGRRRRRAARPHPLAQPQPVAGRGAHLLLRAQPRAGSAGRAGPRPRGRCAGRCVALPRGAAEPGRGPAGQGGCGRPSPSSWRGGALG